VLSLLVQGFTLEPVLERVLAPSRDDSSPG